MLTLTTKERTGKRRWTGSLRDSNTPSNTILRTSVKYYKLPPTQIQLLEARFLSNEVVSPGPVLGGAEGRWEGIGRVGGLAGSLAATPPWASPYPERAPPPPQATVRKLMARALELESKHWTKDEAPQRLDGRCHSELAIDIIQVALTAPPAPASCLWADVPAAKHTPPYSLSFPRPPLPQP